MAQRPRSDFRAARIGLHELKHRLGQRPRRLLLHEVANALDGHMLLLGARNALLKTHMRFGGNHWQDGASQRFCTEPSSVRVQAVF